MAVNEMEEAAKTQLHNLANQSQVTLSSIEERLTRSRRRLDEFHVVVKVCPLMIYSFPPGRTVRNWESRVLIAQFLFSDAGAKTDRRNHQQETGNKTWTISEVGGREKNGFDGSSMWACQLDSQHVENRYRWAAGCWHVSGIVECRILPGVSVGTSSISLGSTSWNYKRFVHI